MTNQQPEIQSVRADLAAWSAGKPPRVQSLARTMDSILEDYADSPDQDLLISDAKRAVASLEREMQGGGRG